MTDEQKPSAPHRVRRVTIERVPLKLAMFFGMTAGIIAAHVQVGWAYAPHPLSLEMWTWALPKAAIGALTGVVFGCCFNWMRIGKHFPIAVELHDE